MTACVLACAVLPAHPAEVSKSYSYYAVAGKTLEQLQEQLSTRGPHVNSTGRKHPGATQMEFATRLGYAESARGCDIAKVAVALEVEIILPRWRRTSAAASEVKLVWDTLSADIKRHEESHVVMARNHASELEQALSAISPKKTCRLAAAEAQEVTTRILKKHDEAQARFDRIELVNFERRFLRLIEYRMQRIEDGRLEN